MRARERCCARIGEAEQLERLRAVRHREHGGREVWHFTDVCTALRVDPRRPWVRRVVPVGQMIGIRKYEVNPKRVSLTINPAESWVTEEGLEAMVSAFAMCSQSRAMAILKCAEA